MFWRKNSKNKEEKIDLVVLKTVQNSIELEILKGILRDSDIACIVKDRGYGGHMRIVAGDSLFYATDILVDKTDYEVAKELIDNMKLE